MSKQMGERDEDVVRSLEQARQNFQQRLDSLGGELKQYWTQWDALIDAHSGELPPEAERAPVRQKMIDLLNRRSYIRNLVRDVNAALES